MIPNISPTIFLEQHLGHHWDAVIYDELEYGLDGKPIRIDIPTGTRQPNGYQSTLMTAETATEVCTKLGELGITNPDLFTRVGVEGEGVTLLFTEHGLARAMQNKALIDATATNPLISETGMEAFLVEHHPDAHPTAEQKAQLFLTDAVKDAVPEAHWVGRFNGYSMQIATHEQRDAAEHALQKKGIRYSVHPSHQPNATSSTFIVNSRNLEALFAGNGPSAQALAYLRALSSEANIAGVWKPQNHSFALLGIDNLQLAAMSKALNDRGIAHTAIPKTSTNETGDGEEHGAMLYVSALAIEKQAGLLESATHRR